MSVFFGNSNTVNGEVYSIQHYVIQFINHLRQVDCFHLWARITFDSDLRQAGGFLRHYVLKFVSDLRQVGGFLSQLFALLSYICGRLVVFSSTVCDKFCQWLATGRWFSPCTPVSSTNKTDRHDITEILKEKFVETKGVIRKWC